MLSKFITTKSAWMTVSVLLSVSLFLNAWSLFVFRLRRQNKIIYCDVKQELTQEYFQITLIYILFIILLPIAVIFICNSMIAYKIIKYTVKPNEEIQMEDLNGDFLTESDKYLRDSMPKNRNKSPCAVKQVVKDLFIISLFYSLFHLLYLINWLYFYYNEIFTVGPEKDTNQNIAYANLKLSEIFYLVNFGINFYIYVTANPQFRKQLKKNSNFIFILA